MFSDFGGTIQKRFASSVRERLTENTKGLNRCWGAGSDVGGKEAVQYDHKDTPNQRLPTVSK